MLGAKSHKVARKPCYLWLELLSIFFIDSILADFSLCPYLNVRFEAARRADGMHNSLIL